VFEEIKKALVVGDTKALKENHLAINCQVIFFIKPANWV
jgi:hypothetical protein